MKLVEPEAYKLKHLQIGMRSRSSTNRPATRPRRIFCVSKMFVPSKQNTKYFNRVGQKIFGTLSKWSWYRIDCIIEDLACGTSL